MRIVDEDTLETFLQLARGPGAPTPMAVQLAVEDARRALELGPPARHIQGQMRTEQNGAYAGDHQ